MGELTPGWKRYRFSDMVTSAGATRKSRGWNIEEAGVDRYVGLEHLDSNSLPIRRWAHPRDVGENSDLRHFEVGDVLLARRGIDLRKVGRAHFRGVASGHALVFRAVPQIVLPEFLPFFIQSDVFMARADRRSMGSLSKTVNLSALMKEEFALPPLEEQRRIVATMQSAQENLKAAQALESRTRTMILSLREQLTTASVGTLVRVGAVAAMQNGRAFPGGKYQKTGIRLLRPANLHMNGHLDWRSKRTVCLPSKYEKDASDYVIRDGDLLINLTAQSLDDGFMGRVCWARSGDESLLNQRIGRITTTSRGLVQEYLFRVLQGARFQRHAISMCEGTKVKHIYWRHIERFTFTKPTVDYQIEACERMFEMDRAREDASQRVRAARQVAAGVLSAALQFGT